LSNRAKTVSLAALTKHLDSLFQEISDQIQDTDQIPTPAMDVAMMLHRVQLWAERHAKATGQLTGGGSSTSASW
jgi:hypothetical protein